MQSVCRGAKLVVCGGDGAWRGVNTFSSCLPSPAQPSSPHGAAAAGKSLSEGMESGEMLGAGCCGL